MRQKASRLYREQTRTAWLFCAPALLFICTFLVVPFFMSAFFSFTDKMLVARAGKPALFIGLENYVKVFSNSTTRQAFINTGLYTLMVVPFILVFGTLLAVFVNRQLRGVSVFRAIYFSPQVVTMTVVVIVWSFIFSASKRGMLNSFLGVFGIPPQRFLQDTKQALVCIAVMYVWQAIGLQMVIILGGLQYISQELYEAAKLDGCTSVQQFFYVTVPQLKNTLVYVFISVTISAFKVFTPIYVLTNGGPRNATVTVVYQLYKVGFLNNQQGYASAISVVFFLFVLAVSLLQNHLVGKED